MAIKLNTHTSFIILAFVLFLIPQCLSVWVNYRTFTGFIPSYTYQVTLNAGDTIRGYLTWNDANEDLDIYLYKSNQDLLSSSTYVTRQFSATTIPQNLVYTIITANTYYLRVDLYSSTPTPYKFQIYRNGQLIRTEYDTVISTTTGTTVQQVLVDGPCRIQIIYDGPIYPLQLFAPGADIVYGTPVAFNNTAVNPKTLSTTVTAAGKWNVVIKHQIYSTKVLTPFTITVQTEVGPQQCINYCSNISYTIGMNPNSATDCLCLTGFTWNTVNKKCVISCSAFNSTSDVGPAVAGTTDQCQCLQANQYWSTIQLACIINCSSIASSTGVSDINGTCVCPTGFMWVVSSLSCIRNCSAVVNSSGLSPTNSTECTCLTNYYWNSSLAICAVNLICGDGFLAGVEQCDDGNTADGDGCNADCTIGNNNGCSASTPYINPTTGSCTSSCPTGYYTNSTNYSCPACSTITVYCSECYSNGSACITCQTLYLYNDATGVCDYTPCNDIHCMTCPSSMSICQTCKTGYELIDNVCVVKCGDGIKINPQQCDDGNTVDGDGCNADCTIGNNNGCSASTPYINPLTSNCTTACPSTYYQNDTIFTCFACFYTCGTCKNATDCLSCLANSNRYLNGTECLPSPGFFDNNTQIAPACMSPCATCTSSSVCVTCVTGSYLSGTTCILCSSVMLNCSQCSSSSLCNQCQLGFILNPTTGVCDVVPCTVTACISCPDSNSVCDACAPGFVLNNNLCQTVCGDNVTAGTEQCDDGNTSDGDGCNADCTTGNNNNCPASSPYRNPITNVCINTCPTGYFPDPTTFTCLACLYTCGTCNNATDCLTCLSTSHRYLNGTQCLPSPGFYDNFTQVAPACVSPCAQCVSLSACTTCVTGFYLSGSICLACSTVTANCSTCDAAGTACTLCQLGFILNATTGFCDVVPCNDINCLVCPNSMAFCTACTLGYQPVNGVCKFVCGDFVIAGSEVCDDGNSVDKDGCSSTCTVEPDFTCEPDPVQTTGSACFYIGDVTVKEVYINKVDGQNKIQILLDLSPNDLTLWDKVDFLDMIEIQSPVPISGYTVTRNPDGTVSIVVDYAADIQNQPIDILIDPSNSGIPAFSRLNQTTTNLLVVPDDNEGAYFYDPATYELAGIIASVCTAISAIAGVFFVLSLISGKMVGVEMMAVVQISFFSLVTLSQLNPCFAALSSLKLVNGYNSLNHNHLADQFTPTKPKGIFLFSRFIENLNFTVAIILVPLLVALISFILSKTAMKQNERVVRIATKSVGQYTLMGILFTGYLTAVSFALELMYGMKNNSDLIGKASLAECAVLLSLMVGYFVFLLLKPEFFGEFTDEFKKDRLSSKYYNYMLFERLLVGSCLVFMLAANIGAVVPLAVLILTGIFITVRKPYRENYHNYRAAANMAIAAIVMGVYLFYTLTAAENRNSGIFLYLPLIVCGLLVICVIYNAGAIVYGIYKMCKTKSDNNKLDQILNDEVLKLKQQVKSNSPRSPLSPFKCQQFSPPIQPMELNDSRSKINLKDIKKQIFLERKQKAKQVISKYQFIKFDQVADTQLDGI